MPFPIIDVSKQSVAQFEAQCSRVRAWQYVAWYRVMRPLLVIGIWFLAARYIRWCLANATPTEVSLEAFVPIVIGIAAVSATLIVWTLARQLDLFHTGRVRRMHDGARAADDAAAPPQRELPVAADAGRCLVAYHDDDGMISHVVSMPDYARQAA
ncbi:hypothetical protein [Paraburkholderia solisilvae]|uniref:Poly-beta-1,6-N-acetyl-D-glucosamine biosynthesis protein PgaD n=1 Tax=Paraburkholderia solisilvae TaxID=624376 RepID=A0A6J5E9I8_9BURK|nr:hypothetical protein [Paraburkholderia solisilvae]CAB3763033.1 hypothetical protein LMG29739_04013 [Paraburkholderia solisilvae]